MSRESQEAFHAALYGGGSLEELRTAAAGHLGASRPLAELTRLYALALENGNHEQAQQLADELAPVRQAEAIVAGGAA